MQHEAIDPGPVVRLAHLYRPVSSSVQVPTKLPQKCPARFAPTSRRSPGCRPCWAKCPKAASTGALGVALWRWMKISQMIHQKLPNMFAALWVLCMFTLTFEWLNSLCIKLHRFDRCFFLCADPGGAVEMAQQLRGRPI